MGGLVSTSGTTVVKEHSLAGRVAIVTGPTSGIGYECSLMLASIGCHVILAGRGVARLQSCVDKLTKRLAKTHPQLVPQLTPIELDLTSFQSIHTFVQTFTNKHLPLHYLFNNAGVMMTDYLHTVDGLELQLGTNCVGPQYLTNLLLPVLITSAPSRIINTSSFGHNMSTYKPEVQDIDTQLQQALYPTEKMYSRTAWYGHSKLGNIYHAREITRRYANQGVIAMACHPGVVATDLGRATWYNNLGYKAFGWCMKNSNQGAATQLWVALDNEWPKHLHELTFYSKDCHLSTPSTLAQNKAFAKSWYDFNDSEITRICGSLGIPSSSSDQHDPVIHQ